MKDTNFCNNCGKLGHLFHQCKNPITSVGIIIFNNDDLNNIKYLMIRRKDSLGYVDFMRGKYPLLNKRYLLNIINEMTNDEKQKLKYYDFNYLWNELWGDFVGNQYKNEEKISKEKFFLLKNGIKNKNISYTLDSLIDESNKNWNEPEWGFAKGRRNYQEKDLNCALREFEEETGIDKNKIKLVQNLLPFEEIFTGSNFKSYKHKYYLAYMEKDDTMTFNFQKSEVSKVNWFSIQECITNIRNYNLEKINIIKNVNYILNNYSFY